MKNKFLLLLLLMSLPTKIFAMLPQEDERSNLSTKNFLVVANGEWEDKVVRTYMPNRTVIALDGAAYKFYQSSLVPHFILGDLDSLKEKQQENGRDYFNLSAALQHFNETPIPSDEMKVKFEEYKPKESDITYIRAHSQDYTDLSKGVKFCLTQRKKNEPVDIIIACALGGDRIDHLFGNFSVLKRYRASEPKYHDVSVKIVNELQVVEYMNFRNPVGNLEGSILKNTRIFTGKSGDKCGFFGYPFAKIKSKGLKWELNDFTLELAVSDSSCNELKDPTVELIITEGEALIMRPNVDFQKIN